MHGLSYRFHHRNRSDSLKNTVVLLNFSFIWSLNVLKCRNGYLFLERKMISQKLIISLFSPSLSTLLNKTDEVLLKKSK